MRTRKNCTCTYSIAVVILITLSISAYFSRFLFDKRPGVTKVSVQKQFYTSVPHIRNTEHQADLKTITRKHLSSEKINILREIQRQRDQNIKRVCIGELHRKPLVFSKKGLRKDLLLINEKLKITFVNDDHKLLVTVVFKTGSEGWKSVFKQLQKGSSPNLARKDGILNLADVSEFLGDEAVAYRLKNYFSVIFVRHPYSRLISAYNAKLVKLPNDFYSNKARKIIRRIRRVNVSSDQVPDLQFKEFVQYIANTRASNDEHWCPIYPEVKPCFVYYDFVGHLETLQDDMKYLFKLIGIEDIAEYPSAPQGAKSSDRTTLKEYFSKIPQTMIEKLNSKYGNDFKVFGYHLPVNNTDFD